MLRRALLSLFAALFLSGPAFADILTVPGGGGSAPGGSSGQVQYNNAGALGGLPLWLDATNVIGQRNGTNVQTFNVYGTYTDAANYERFSTLLSGGTDFVLEAQNAGTGLARNVALRGHTSVYIDYGSQFFFRDSASSYAIRWQLNSSGHLSAGADNTYDIGASGANRPRNVYVAGKVVVGGTLQLPTYTVAGLPTCNAGTAHSMAYVSDATAPTYNGALTGGGAVSVPVGCDGTVWTSH